MFWRGRRHRIRQQHGHRVRSIDACPWRVLEDRCSCSVVSGLDVCYEQDTHTVPRDQLMGSLGSCGWTKTVTISWYRIVDAWHCADSALLGTAREDIHWAVPVMSALPFGMGFLLLFMSLIKYLAFLLHCFDRPSTDLTVVILLMRTKCLQQALWQLQLVRGACLVQFCRSRQGRCK
jgi:hypothetical protein